MSRIGKLPIKIPAGVKVEVKDSLLKVEGPKGKLSHNIPRGVSAKVDAGAIVINRHDDIVPNGSALQGLTRTLVHNMVHGAHTGFTKELDIVGVGYRAAVKGQVLSMTLGYSHPVDFTLPAGIAAKVDANTHVTVSGA